jgi:hypothetical protein
MRWNHTLGSAQIDAGFDGLLVNFRNLSVERSEHLSLGALGSFTPVDFVIKACRDIAARI